MMKTLHIGIKILVFIIMVVIVAEVFLHAARYLSLDPTTIAIQNYLREYKNHIHAHWLDTSATNDLFSPPFLVFSNRNSDDEERLRAVFEATKLPASNTWTTHDFLQSDSKASLTRYTVRSNALGFRDRERDKKKDDDTYRIIVLGSYQAFGMGVNDDETYPAQLEQTLNAASEGTRFEVWNGGRPAGTAIVGLARMKHEIFDYDPDLLIFDYGFMDTNVFGDNLFPIAMRFPDDPLFLALRSTLRALTPLWENSLLFYNATNKPQLLKMSPERISHFTSTLSSMIALAREHSTEVILLRQSLALPPSIYEDFVAHDVHFLDVDEIFRDNPPHYPPPEDWDEDYWAATWLSDIDPAWVIHDPETFRDYPYRLTRFQLNSKGQLVVGTALADYIRTSVLENPIVQ